MPEKSKAKELCRALAYEDGRPRGAIVYTNSQATSYAWEDEDLAPVRKISTNRDEMIDDLAWDLQAGKFWLPTRRLSEVLTACEHFTRLVKVRDQRTGALHYRKGVENHYGLAAAMGRLAKAIAPALLPAPAEHFQTSRRGEESRHTFGTRYFERGERL